MTTLTRVLCAAAVAGGTLVGYGATSEQAPDQIAGRPTGDYTMYFTNAGPAAMDAAHARLTPTPEGPAYARDDKGWEYPVMDGFDYPRLSELEIEEIHEHGMAYQCPSLALAPEKSVQCPLQVVSWRPNSPTALALGGGVLIACLGGMAMRWRAATSDEDSPQGETTT